MKACVPYVWKPRPGKWWRGRHFTLRHDDVGDITVKVDVDNSIISLLNVTLHTIVVEVLIVIKTIFLAYYSKVYLSTVHVHAFLFFKQAGKCSNIKIASLS